MNLKFTNIAVVALVLSISGCANLDKLKEITKFESVEQPKSKQARAYEKQERIKDIVAKTNINSKYHDKIESSQKGINSVESNFLHKSVVGKSHAADCLPRKFSVDNHVGLKESMDKPLVNNGMYNASGMQGMIGNSKYKYELELLEYFDESCEAKSALNLTSQHSFTKEMVVKGYYTTSIKFSLKMYDYSAKKYIASEIVTKKVNVKVTSQSDGDTKNAVSLREIEQASDTFLKNLLAKEK